MRWCRTSLQIGASSSDGDFHTCIYGEFCPGKCCLGRSRPASERSVGSGLFRIRDGRECGTCCICQAPGIHGRSQPVDSLADAGCRCPACGEETVDKLAIYTASQFNHVRVEACDTCGHYIKTFDLTKNGLAVPVVDELATIPLNTWAHERDALSGSQICLTSSHALNAVAAARAPITAMSGCGRQSLQGKASSIIDPALAATSCTL
jgi:Zn ribbon nucleic-acid-binding protein